MRIPEWARWWLDQRVPNMGFHWAAQVMALQLMAVVLLVGIMGHLPSLDTSIYVKFLLDSLPESARRDFVVSSVGYR